MRVRVRYKQKFCGFTGMYSLIRIIEQNPDNLIFKGIVKQDVCSSAGQNMCSYMGEVKRVLQYTEEELVNSIKETLRNHNANPETLNDEIKDYDIEVEVNI